MGVLSEPAFNLLNMAMPLYQRLLQRLGRLGLKVPGVKYEGPTLPEVNFSWTVFELNAVGRLRLERFEADFFKAHEIGTEIMQEFVAGGWEAVHDSDPRLGILSHTVVVNQTVQLLDDTYGGLVGKYVTPPGDFGPNTECGVAFYVRGMREHVEEVSVVLDRLGPDQQAFVLKTTTVVAGTVGVGDVGVLMDEVLRRVYHVLQLEVE